MSPDGARQLRREPLLPAELVQWLRREGERRYHARHAFHERMHAGELTREELQRWALNRFYYQTRIPIKDAILLSKSDDPAFRRVWLRRIVDHDGAAAGEGGLEQWLRLGEALGVARERMLSLEDVLPGVRFACDAYVNLVRERSWLEGVAASLTECFAPDLMSRRIAAFERYYPFIDKSGLQYFRARVPRASRDAEEALRFVVAGATTFALQSACVQALVHKTEVLWHLLDCIAAPSNAGSTSNAAAG
jgi:pyrroloquinoline-quinone synthase